MKLGICYLGQPMITHFFGGVTAPKVHPLRIAGLAKAKRILPIGRN